MASTYSDLKIELIGTGDQTGTWGLTTNTNLGTAIEEAITGTADVTFSNNDVEITLSNTNSSQTARNLRLNLIGSINTNQNLTVPAIKKFYLVNNNLTYNVTVKCTGGIDTGVIVPAGTATFLFNVGTYVVNAISYLSTLYLGVPLGVASGGTGASTAGTAPFAQKGTNTDITSIGGLTTPLSVAQGGTGVSTGTGSGSVVLSNSPVLAGTPTTPTATAGTNTLQIASTAFVTSAVSTATGSLGTMSTQNANSVSITGGSIAGAVTATTLSSTGNTTFNTLLTAGEKATVSATAATGTIAYDILSQSVIYYTTNASANWTLNIRGNSGTTLNSVMATGEARTITFLVTQGATPYYNNVVQVDGTTTGVTTKWQGAVPIAGNASGIDAYTYSVVKTGASTYTVFASQVQFK